MMIALAGLCLVLTGAWDHGATGLAPLLRGFATAAATIALGSLALGTSDGRAWAFGVLPVAWLLATAGRLALRPVLRRRSAQAADLVLDPDLAGYAGSRTRMVDLDGLHLLRLARPALPASAQILKSALDRTVALGLLVLTAPLLLALALALAASLDGRPALVRQLCVDARGRTFGLLKFRTGGRRISAFVRRHGLDALPQLLNVLAGSMAIVGPRPSSADEVARRVRHPPLVAPGLTGLGGLADADRLDGAELESRYVENWSPALDVRLLASALRSACRRMSR
jgi:lipopolysaccharide/colanic/teichoic acid biosynthesis glycosyltransferase